MGPGALVMRLSWVWNRRINHYMDGWFGVLRWGVNSICVIMLKVFFFSLMMMHTAVMCTMASD